ncbi:MAG: formate/nitrite transporter family protein [Bacilli bacterium]|nr:formate/nitrite transporter family protein [Bacilli bacterium]
MKNYLVTFLKGILAGLAIGLGGFLYILMTFLFSGDNAELGKIFGSILFSVGLFLVCTFSLSLYTGKIGLVYEEKQSKEFYISLPIMLIGNAIGAFAFGYICFFIFRSSDVYFSALATANARLQFNDVLDYLTTAIKAFLCGLCVYLAVKSFSLNRLKPLGITLLVFFVFVFVYCGFQHCIANMFYFGMANTMSWYTLINLLIVILFNSLGPIVGVKLVKLIQSNYSK